MCTLMLTNVFIYFLPHAGKVKLWKIALVVITAIFCALGGVLWSAVGVVVLNSPNGSKLKPWRLFFLSEIRVRVALTCFRLTLIS